MKLIYFPLFLFALIQNLYFKEYEKYFLVPIDDYLSMYDQSIKEGRKSIPYSYFKKEYTMKRILGLDLAQQVLAGLSRDFVCVVK